MRRGEGRGGDPRSETTGVPGASPRRAGRAVASASGSMRRAGRHRAQSTGRAAAAAMFCVRGRVEVRDASARELDAVPSKCSGAARGALDSSIIGSGSTRGAKLDDVSIKGRVLGAFSDWPPYDFRGVPPRRDASNNTLSVCSQCYIGGGGPSSALASPALSRSCSSRRRARTGCATPANSATRPPSASASPCSVACTIPPMRV